MKSATLFTSLTFCFILVSVKAYSEPDCSQQCNPKHCPVIPECNCGTYKDYCQCCDFCLKCPGEECSIIGMEKCAYGKSCEPPPGADALARFNGPGRCT